MIIRHSWKPLLFLSGTLVAGCGFNDENTIVSTDSSYLDSVVEVDMVDGPLVSSKLSLEDADLPDKKYVADLDHSSISFRTKHWEIVDLIGWFTDFNVIMYSDSADFSDAEIYAEVDPRSLRMPNSKMEQTAQKHPYMDTEKFPKATFRSKRFQRLGEKHYELVGDFSLNGISKEVTFYAQLNGFAYPGEKRICGFDVRGKIDRNAFKIAGEDTLHSGRKIHGDTIELLLSLRME